MKLGLALSGGGIRGFAHAGVLKALEENNIKIDIISGTSSGSLVATLYAMGISPYYIYILAKKYAKEIVASSNVPIITEIGNLMVNKKMRINGFNSGERLEAFLDAVAQKRGVFKISDINIPLIIPAVDIANSKKYVFTSIKDKIQDNYITDIPIGKAVRASCSFPVVFSPCEYKEYLFMDGGILDNTPALELKKQDADKIISIKFDSDTVTHDSNIMDIVMKTIDIMGNKISDESLEISDVIVTIPTDATGLLETQKLDFCYKAGYNAVMENMEKIKKVLK